MSEIFSVLDYNAAKYKTGEKPYVSVMNRPIDALRSTDIQLDGVLQFLARSFQLRVTDGTKMLMHFDGNGDDVVSEFEPSQTGTDSEIFAFDGFMRGAAFVQDAASNLLATATGLNPALTSLNGWSISDTSAAGASLTVNSTGLTVDNLKALSVSAGDVEIKATEFDCAPGHPLAYALEFETPNNLPADGVSVEIGLRFSATSGGVVMATRSTTVQPVVWGGIINVEDSSIPAGAEYATAFIRISYSANSRVSLRFKNFMVEDSKISHLFTNAVKPATSLSYPASVDFSGESVSIIGWTKFTQGFLTNHMLPVNPVCLVSANGALYVAPEHTHDDAGNLILNLVTTNGTARTAVSTDITLSGAERGKYLPFVLRLNKTAKTAEFAIVTSDYVVHKASVALPSTIPTGKWTLKVGRGDSRTEAFNCPVSELRCDTELINDFELLVIALARKPFISGMDAEGEVQDRPFGVNLIENPCGKFSNFFWSAFPVGFQASVEDNDVGAGFIWSGEVSGDTDIKSELIEIASGQNFRLEGYLGSAEDTVGEHGLKVSFYAANGTTPVGSPLTVPAIPRSSATKYELSSTGIPGATYMRVSMYMLDGFTSGKAYWTRLKAEYGDASVFSDDSSPAFATYAP